MSIINRNAAAVNSDTADSWPAWTDNARWEPNEPEPAEPPAVERAGSTSVTVHALAGRFWVDWRIDGRLEDARSFPTVEDARRYAAAIFGDGGSDPDDDGPEWLVSPLEHWLQTAAPEPELSPSGAWVMPGSYDLPPSGGID
jgi:hypothetical protein